MPISSISKRLGTAVRNPRMAAGLSQEMLEERAGLRPTNVSMVECVVRSPTLDVSAAIAETLQIGLPRLVEEAQQERRVNTTKNQRMPNRPEIISRRECDWLGSTL